MTKLTEQQTSSIIPVVSYSYIIYYSKPFCSKCDEQSRSYFGSHKDNEHDTVVATSKSPQLERDNR